MAKIYPNSNRIFSGNIRNVNRLNSFSSLKELDATITANMRIAYQKTLDRMAKKLHEFIADDVYNNAYTTSTMNDKNNNDYIYESKWGGRTGSLLDERSIETYVYNAFGKGIAGGIRFNDQPYYENMDLQHFIHGNKYWGQLAFSSYLEMLNNPMLLPENPYGFPTFNDFHRDSFWYDFVKWADDNFDKIFKFYMARLGSGDNRAIASSMNVDIDNLSNSMNLSRSTSNVQSLNTGTLSETVDTAFHGTVTVTDASGTEISSTTY